MKKGSPNYESESSNKVKNQLEFNVDKQHGAIKHLKEYCDIDDIDPPCTDRAVCVICNQPFG